MSTHNICFYGEIKKISILNFWLKKVPYQIITLTLEISLLLASEKGTYCSCYSKGSDPSEFSLSIKLSPHD